MTKVAIREVEPTCTRWLCVKGRLREKVSFWKSELAARDVVVSIIESGYVIEFNINKCS